MRIFILAALLAVVGNVFGAEDTFKAGNFTFTKPEKFKLKPAAGGMRAAELEFEADGKKAEVVFFSFPGGGGTQANVDRWIRQFPDAKDQKTAKTEKKGDVTFVEVEGTYSSGMPGGPQTPQPGTKLLGAIMENASGNVFVKMTGPIATVKAAEADFRKMIEGAKK